MRWKNILLAFALGLVSHAFLYADEPGDFGDVFCLDKKRTDALPEWITYIYRPIDGKKIFAYLRPLWDERGADVAYLCEKFSAKVETARGEWAFLPVTETEIINAPARYTLLYDTDNSASPRLMFRGENLRQRLREYVKKNPESLSGTHPIKVILGFNAYKLSSEDRFVEDGLIESDYILLRLHRDGAFKVIGYSANSISGTHAQPFYLSDK